VLCSSYHTDNQLPSFDSRVTVLSLTVCKYAESKGCVQFKFVSVNNRGVPDRIIITPVGEVLFVEFNHTS
jgi:hypothetical protein